jgi:hypothetical protein
VLSLLRGLLFRGRDTIHSLVQKPNFEQASQLNFFLIVMSMINTAFFIGMDPSFSENLHLGPLTKWFAAFIAPPILYYFQRFLFVWTSRFGLMMLANNKMTRDPEEKQRRNALLRMIFPYTIFPTTFFSVISTPFDTSFIGVLLLMLGFVYAFLLSIHALSTIYDVSPAAAFFGPLIVQFIVGILVSVLIAVCVLAGLALGFVPIDPSLLPPK